MRLCYNILRCTIFVETMSTLGCVQEVSDMAKCSVCGKGGVFGQNVSHSNRKTNRSWKPNIRKVKAIVDGTPTTVAVCSRCLRSGKVTRA